MTAFLLRIPPCTLLSISTDRREAVKAHVDFKSEHSVSMHFSLFQLTCEPVDQPVTDLNAGLQTNRIDATRFRVFELRQARVVAPREASA